MNDPTSVTGRRIGAWFIDLLIYLVLFVVVLLASGGIEKHTGVPSDFCSSWRATHSSACSFVNNNGENTAYTVGSGGVSLLFVAHFVVYCLIQGLLGGSLGKLALGLRVVKADGQRCGIGRSFLRTLLWIVDAITLGFPIVGGILILSTKGHRRVGDMAAGTFVVSKRDEGKPVQVPGLNVAPVYAGGYPGQGGGYPQGGSPAAPNPGWGQAPAPDTSSTPGQPQWDEARKAYIQYDQGRGTWLQYDDGSKEWKPIST